MSQDSEQKTLETTNNSSKNTQATLPNGSNLSATNEVPKKSAKKPADATPAVQHRQVTFAQRMQTIIAKNLAVLEQNRK